MKSQGMKKNDCKGRKMIGERIILYEKWELRSEDGDEKKRRIRKK